MFFSKLPLLVMVTVLALSISPVAAEVTAPQITGPVHPPVAAPYDVNIIGIDAVDQALGRAKANGKRVLIDLGGNWCPDCRILAGVIETPQIRAFLEQYFEIVSVDVGRYDKNLDVPARFGIEKPSAAPTILIVDPQNSAVINAEKSRDLRDARSMEPQAILEWLARWAKQPG